MMMAKETMEIKDKTIWVVEWSFIDRSMWRLLDIFRTKKLADSHRKRNGFKYRITEYRAVEHPHGTVLTDRYGNIEFSPLTPKIEIGEKP